MAEKNINEQLEEFIEYIKNSINCQCPAKIITVNSDGTVDIEVFRNDEIANQKLIHVKIRHIETQNAFIFLGISSGDFGVVRYFDRSTNDYIEGEDGYNYDDRSHNVNDACFELGFIPNPSSYVYPVNHDLVLGTKDGTALLSFDKGGTISIIGGNVSIGGSSSVIIDGSSNTTIDGKNFLSHQHTDSLGGTTTGVI